MEFIWYASTSMMQLDGQALHTNYKAILKKLAPLPRETGCCGGKLRRGSSYKGSLTAWGCKDTDNPFNGPPRQKLVRDEWPPGIEIDFDGHVREKEGWDRSIH